MRPVSSWPLTTKLAVVVATLLALALASIGVTLWITLQLDGGAMLRLAGRAQHIVTLRSGAPQLLDGVS